MYIMKVFLISGLENTAATAIAMMIAVFIAIAGTQAMLQPTEVSVCKPGPTDRKMEKERCQGGYAIRCDNRSLNDVPKTYPKYKNASTLCLLDLSRNNISRIRDYSFVGVSEILQLFLYDNRISQIDSTAFANLTNLLFLNLTNNRLHFPDSFGKGVFSPLVNLSYINLKNNPITSYDGIPSYLQPLKNLSNLLISGCYKCKFGEGFENLRQLRKVSLSGTGPDTCNMSVLSNDTFKYLSQISVLFLSSCNIKSVDTGTFSPLYSMLFLDISYNENLQFEGMRNVLEGLQHPNSSIETLNFNHINEYLEMGTMLKRKHIEPIKNLHKLTLLFLDLNKIEVIEEEVFDLIPNSTERIGMSGNRLTNGQYVKKISNMTHLKSLDLSLQHLNYDPFFNQHFEPWSDSVTETWSNQHTIDEAHSGGNNELITPLNPSTGSNWECSECVSQCAHNTKCLCIPPNLENLTWRKSFLDFQIGRFKICPPSTLKRVDVSFNLISEWTGPVSGLETVESLDLAENYCQKLSLNFFDTFNNLRRLNTSYNFLGQAFSLNGENKGKYFKNLTKLELLDLSENRITALPSDIFRHLRNLKYLHLSRNLIGKWSGTLNAKCLVLMDLSENKLETLPESLRTYLDEIVTHNKMCNRSGIQVELSGNPIQCNCESRPFLRWMINSHVQFSPIGGCELSNGQQKFLTDKDSIRDIVKSLDKECFPYVSVIMSLSMFIVGIALCFAIYRYRWKLRHWYYSKHKRHRHKGYDRLFERDAFISYPSTEGSFIMKYLVPSLEERRNLKVWIADRGSVPGASIAENLTHAINFSKKSVLLISRGYFKEGWCDYEMNMARVESIESSRKLIIIVLLEDIVAKDIPLDYLRLLRSEQSIEYPNNSQDYNTFWDTLSTAIQNE